MPEVNVLVAVKNEFTGERIKEVARSAETLGMNIFPPLLSKGGIFIGSIDSALIQALKDLTGVQEVETEEELRRDVLD